jgi:hypothetical protein
MLKHCKNIPNIIENRQVYILNTAIYSLNFLAFGSGETEAQNGVFFRNPGIS